MNQLWKLDSEFLAAYTEDPSVMESIRRYYSYPVMAEYYRHGKRFAVQYRVPASRKRSISRLLNCVVEVA